MPIATPRSTVRSAHHMVASADQLATSAGNAIFALGGNAVDAAIATNAAIAVTGPHLCGIGGDLFALIHIDDPSTPDVPGETFALNASGRAGSGADASGASLRGLHRHALQARRSLGDRARLRRRMDGAAPAIRIAPPRRDPGAGPSPRGHGVSCEPAPRGVAAATRRNQPFESRRTRWTSDHNRRHRPSTRRSARAHCAARQRTRRLLSRRVR